MPSFTLNAASAEQRSLATNEIGIIGLQGVLAPSVGAVSMSGNARLVIGGIVAPQSGSAVTGSVGPINIQIGASGFVAVAGTAVSLRYLSSSDLVIQNAGTIQTVDRGINLMPFETQSIVASGGTHRISNTGTIDAVAEAVYLRLATDTISVVSNTGTILSAERTAIVVQGTAGSLALYNGGQIVNAAAGGALASTNRTNLTNDGLIDGRVLLSAANDTLLNTGLIRGQVYLGGGNDTFDSRGGRVLGEVYGGGGNDIYIIDDSAIIVDEAEDGGDDHVFSAAPSFVLPAQVERLTLIGAAQSGVGNDLSNLVIGTDLANFLAGGAGNDTLIGRGGEDRLDGGTGNDRIEAGDGADTALGGIGEDLILAGDGRDWMYGESGNDTVYGESGDDFLFGGAGVDVLFGGNHEDALDGGAGNDTLWGGAGDDTLTGGMGSDSLTGAAGRDVFRFLTTAESPNDAGRDVIADFVRGEDLIDLTALDGDPVIGGNQPLTFIGAAPFSGAGQVRVLMVGADAYVQVNTVGLVPSEMMIFVRGSGPLEATDFIL